MKSNNKGFAIMIAMGLVILITLVAMVILSFIMPFSKSVKGIENTTLAYYNGYSGIEGALHHFKNRDNLTTETGANLVSNGSGHRFTTYSSGNVIPRVGKGNSEFAQNKDYNIISLSEPLQIQIGKGFVNDWNNVNFTFKLPLSGTLSGGTTTPIINWMLSSQNDTLLSSGSYITADDVKVYNCNSSCTWNIKDKTGVRLDGTQETFSDFYSSNCNLAGSGCILKMSVINDLVLTPSGANIPYLEYKITFTGSVPDRYSYIESYGLSVGFQKKLEIGIPQETVNTALDFTVFQ